MFLHFYLNNNLRVQGVKGERAILLLSKLLWNIIFFYVFLILCLNSMVQEALSERALMLLSDANIWKLLVFYFMLFCFYGTLSKN